MYSPFCLSNQKEKLGRSRLAINAMVFPRSGAVFDFDDLASVAFLGFASDRDHVVEHRPVDAHCDLELQAIDIASNQRLKEKLHRHVDHAVVAFNLHMLAGLGVLVARVAANSTLQMIDHQERGRCARRRPWLGSAVRESESRKGLRLRLRLRGRGWPQKRLSRRPRSPS